VREHELAAQWTLLIFAFLVPAFAMLWALPLLRHRELPRNLGLGLLVLWLLLSAAGVLAVARTGHLGGHLVHDLHDHAYPEPPPG
jgi:flagellar biosynthesis protein FliR